MTAFDPEIYVYLITGVLALGATAVVIVPFLFLSPPATARSRVKPAEDADKVEAAWRSVPRKIDDGSKRLVARLLKLWLAVRRPVDVAVAAASEANADERPPFWRRKRDSLRRIRALRLRMPIELAGAAEAPAGQTASLPEPPPVMTDVSPPTISEPVAAVPGPPVAADVPSIEEQPPPVVEEQQMPSAGEQPVPSVEEQAPSQPPAEPDLPSAQRLSVEDMAEREENVDKMQDKMSEESEEKEERYLAEDVSDDVKEIFGTGLEDEDDDDDDDDEEKSELDSMLDLFSTELVEETDANRLAALLGEVDARDLLSEAQEILNELRSPARGGG